MTSTQIGTSEKLWHSRAGECQRSMMIRRKFRSSRGNWHSFTQECQAAPAVAAHGSQRDDLPRKPREAVTREAPGASRRTTAPSAKYAAPSLDREQRPAHAARADRPQPGVEDRAGLGVEQAVARRARRAGRAPAGAQPARARGRARRRGRRAAARRCGYRCTEICANSPAWRTRADRGRSVSGHDAEHGRVEAHEGVRADDRHRGRGRAHVQRPHLAVADRRAGVPARGRAGRPSTRPPVACSASASSSASQDEPVPISRARA